MKIAVAQLNSNDDIARNFGFIKKLIEEAKDQNPKIIFFPENSFYFRIKNSDLVKSFSVNSLELQELQVLSDQVGISFHFTSAIMDENHKVYNASILITPNNKIPEIIYRKIHLFDISLQGQAAIRESDVFTAGTKVTSFNFGTFKFGNSICYDLRFSELYHQHAKNRVDVILVPAAFLVKTGQAHWESLLRTRAIESQAYVVAAAQSGRHVSLEGGVGYRETYGHSVIIDPWGQIIEEKPEGVGLIYASIDHSIIESVRNQIPMSQHRRL